MLSSLVKLSLILFLTSSYQSYIHCSDNSRSFPFILTARQKSYITDKKVSEKNTDQNRKDKLFEKKIELFKCLE